MLEAQYHMDVIHDPRNYTKHQTNLMQAIVGYVFGVSRLDIKFAANELTENIALLGELLNENYLMPSDMNCIP